MVVRFVLFLSLCAVLGCENEATGGVPYLPPGPGGSGGDGVGVRTSISPNFPSSPDAAFEIPNDITNYSSLPLVNPHFVKNGSEIAMLSNNRIFASSDFGVTFKQIELAPEALALIKGADPIKTSWQDAFWFVTEEVKSVTVGRIRMSGEFISTMIPLGNIRPDLSKPFSAGPRMCWSGEWLMCVDEHLRITTLKKLPHPNFVGISTPGLPATLTDGKVILTLKDYEEFKSEPIVNKSNVRAGLSIYSPICQTSLGTIVGTVSASVTGEVVVINQRRELDAFSTWALTVDRVESCEEYNGRLIISGQMGWGSHGDGVAEVNRTERKTVALTDHEGSHFSRLLMPGLWGIHRADGFYILDLNTGKRNKVSGGEYHLAFGAFIQSLYEPQSQIAALLNRNRILFSADLFQQSTVIDVSTVAAKCGQAAGYQAMNVLGAGRFQVRTENGVMDLVASVDPSGRVVTSMSCKPSSRFDARSNQFGVAHTGHIWHLTGNKSVARVARLGDPAVEVPLPAEISDYYHLVVVPAGRRVMLSYQADIYLSKPDDSGFEKVGSKRSASGTPPEYIVATDLGADGVFIQAYSYIWVSKDLGKTWTELVAQPLGNNQDRWMQTTKAFKTSSGKIWIPSLIAQVDVAAGKVEQPCKVRPRLGVWEYMCKTPAAQFSYKDGRVFLFENRYAKEIPFFTRALEQ